MNTTLSNELVSSIKGKFRNNGYNPAIASHRAVFLDKAHPGCSDKYVLIQTALVLGSLIKSGIDFEWEVLKQDKARTGYAETKAMIVAVYFKLNDPEIGNVGKFALYIINSGNRTKKLRLAYGFLNGACLNGCIWGNILAEVNQIHYGKDALKNVEDELYQICAQIKQILSGERLKDEFDAIKKMQATPVTKEVALEIAQQAFALRYKSNPMSEQVFGQNPTLKIADLNLESLTKSHRKEFSEMNLWNLYQTIHENIGGNFDKRKEVPKVQFKLLKNDDTEAQVGKVRSIRNSSDIDGKVQLNMHLMDLFKQRLQTQVAA